jgi:hypothetical protein
VHHIRHWAHGGTTDLDNLVIVVQRAPQRNTLHRVGGTDRRRRAAGVSPAGVPRPGTGAPAQSPRPTTRPPRRSSTTWAGAPVCPHPHTGPTADRGSLMPPTHRPAARGPTSPLPPVSSRRRLGATGGCTPAGVPAPHPVDRSRRGQACGDRGGCAPMGGPRWRWERLPLELRPPLEAPPEGRRRPTTTAFSAAVPRPPHRNQQAQPCRGRGGSGSRWKRPRRPTTHALPRRERRHRGP